MTKRLTSSVKVEEEWFRKGIHKIEVYPVKDPCPDASAAKMILKKIS